MLHPSSGRQVLKLLMQHGADAGVKTSEAEV